MPHSPAPKAAGGTIAGTFRPAMTFSGAASRCGSVPINYLDEERVDIIVRNAILEDLATLDVTTEATVPFTLQGTAKFLAKQDGVLAGMQFAFYAFKMLEPRAELNALVEEGGAFS